MTKSIYKTGKAKEEILKLYDERLKACNMEYEDIYVDTFAGETHVIATGDKSNPPLIVLHGINAGAPMALESIKGLNKKYRIYGIDTVGQSTKSAETRLPMQGGDYGKWIIEVMNKIGIEKACFIGVSYGAFLLQKVMVYYPERITKGIFVVPSGFVNGPFFKSMQKLTFPLIKFMRSKTDEALTKFMEAFYSEIDRPAIDFQKNVLLGVEVDYRRPLILKKTDVAKLTAPVYAMVADDDIFFPGDVALERCKNIFTNFKGFYILKNSKHIPAKNRYAEIEQVIGKWLAE